MKKSERIQPSLLTKKIFKKVVLSPVQVKVLDYKMDFGAQKMLVRYGLN
mgnify:CR=1 FL=1|jgi:hypothetical protein